MTVRFVSVMRRTVLNRKGDCVTWGHANEPVGALDGPMGMVWPEGIFGLPSRSESKYLGSRRKPGESSECLPLEKASGALLNGSPPKPLPKAVRSSIGVFFAPGS